VERAPKLFAGVGNVLRCDDGAGVCAARVLESLPLPPDVEVRELGTAGLAAAPLLEGRSLVVIADAVDLGAEPGTLFRLTPERIRPYAQTGLSLHEVHLLHALDETRLRGRAPGAVVILAVQVADVSLGVGLSPAVDRALDGLLRRAAAELGMALPPERWPARFRLGRDVQPRGGPRWR